jgi:hypothetical protein
VSHGDLAVALRRLDALKAAITDSDSFQVEFTYDQVLRAVQKADRPARQPRTKLCNICRVNRVPIGVHACETCE